MTASKPWPTSIFKMEKRSTNSWQHRLKRERPTCTERKIAHEECGWKGGDSGNSAHREILSNEKKQQNHLTPIGLLMEGLITTNVILT